MLRIGNDLDRLESEWVVSTIESVEDMGARIAGSWSVNSAGEALILAGIRAARHAIERWCEEHAGEADREAVVHEAQLAHLSDLVTVAGKRDRIARCEGQASAFRALAAVLRGGA